MNIKVLPCPTNFNLSISTMSTQPEKNTKEAKTSSLVNKSLQCMECRTEFNEDVNYPVLLKCLHTVCAPCLRNSLNDSSVQCPQCSLTVRLSRSSIDELPVDYARLDRVRYNNLNAKHICANCETDVEFRCQDCEIFLCVTCKQNHTKIRKMRSHSIIAISDIADASDLKQEMLCKIPEHKNRPLDVYCDSDMCKRAMCSMCWMDGHADNDEHKRKDITIAFEEKRDALLIAADKLNANNGQFGNIERKIDTEMDTINRQTIDTEFEITTFFDTCIRILERRKQSLLEELNALSETNLDKLRNQKSDVKSRKDKISHATLFLEQSCTSRNPAAFLGLAPTIMDHFQNLDNIKSAETKDLGTTIFLPDEKGSEFHKSLKQFGSVITFEKKISIPNTVYRNISSSFEIFMKGSPEISSSYDVSIVIEEQITGKKAILETNYADNYLYKANCTINCVGKYRSEILVNGVVIAECILECIEKEGDALKYDSDENEVPDDDGDDNGESMFCNGKEYNDLSDDCGSSDVYLEEEDDDTGSEHQEIQEGRVSVNGLTADISTDKMEAYFDKVSDKNCVVNIEVDSDGETITVVFESQSDMDKICGEHIIEGQKLTVKLSGREKIPIPRSVVIKDLNKNKIKFLSNSSVSRDAIDKRLQRLYAKVDWSFENPNGDALRIDCELRPVMENFKRKARFWDKVVEHEIDKFMETLSVTEEKIKREEWDFMEERVNDIQVRNNQRVSIFEDTKNLYVIIVGYIIPCKEAKAKVLLLTTDVQVHEKLEDFQIHLLKEGKVLDSINQQYKGIKIVAQGARHLVKFCGTAAVVAAAKQKMADILDQVSEVPIHGFTAEKIKLLQAQDVKAVLEDFLIENGQVGAWRIKSDNTLVMCALSESTAKNAAQLVEESVVEIDVSPHPDKKMWDKEVEDVKKKKGGHVDIMTTDDNKVVIFAIPKMNARAIEEHVKIFHKYPDKKVRGTAHFSTKSGQNITTVVGDITDLDNDVIVCSSNRSLNLSVGVGESLIKKGGNQIQKECHDYLAKKQSKQLEEDEVFFTTAGKLRGKMVAHIGGRTWSQNLDKEKASMLKVVYKTMQKTTEKGLVSFAIPAVYTGHSGFPVKDVTEWIVEAVDKFLQDHGQQTTIRNIYLCDKIKETVDAFAIALERYYSLAYKRE